MTWIAPPPVGSGLASGDGLVLLARMDLAELVRVDAYRFEIATGAAGWAQLVVMFDDGGEPGGLFASAPPESTELAQMSERLGAVQVIPAGTWWVGLGLVGDAEFRAVATRLLVGDVRGSVGEGRRFAHAGSLPDTAPAAATAMAVPRVQLRLA